MVSSLTSTPRGGVRAVLDVCRHAHRIHVAARTTLRSHNPTTVVDAEQERAALCVRQAGHSLGQVAIVEVRLELGCQRLATAEEIGGVHRP